jgi:hypothetical protein
MFLGWPRESLCEPSQNNVISEALRGPSKQNTEVIKNLKKTVG